MIIENELYSSLIANNGFEKYSGLTGVMSNDRSIYLVKIADNDFLKDKVVEYSDFTSFFENINARINNGGESIIVQFDTTFFDIASIRRFLSIEKISRDGAFSLSEKAPLLPIIYRFKEYYAFISTINPDSMDEKVDSGRYFIQSIMIPDKRKSFKIKVYAEIKKNMKIESHSTYIPSKFASLVSIADWKEYLMNNYPDTFKVDDWITKSIAYLLVDFCDKDTLTMQMPSITLNKFIDRMSIDDPTKITLKLFEIITQLKDSRIVSRSGRKESSKSFMNVEMNYLNLTETRISLLPSALKEILELPDEFRVIAEDYQEYRNTPIEERRLEGMGIPKPPIGRIIEPSNSLDDCILSPSVKTEIEGFINSIERREKLLIWGVDYVPKLLLAGVIGTGKTITAQAIAAKLGMLLYRVSGEDVVASYLGETAKNVLQAFDFAAKYKSRLILFFDEMDSIVSKRGFDSSASKELARSVNTFITLMEERNELIIGATNHAHEIDASCLSRFTKLIFYELPDIAMMEHLLEIHLKKIPMDVTISIKEIAPRLVEHHFSGRDVRNLVVEIVQELLVANVDVLKKETLERCLERTVNRTEKFLKASKEYKQLLENN